MVTYGRSLRTPTDGYGRPSHTSPHTPPWRPKASERPRLGLGLSASNAAYVALSVPHLPHLATPHLSPVWQT